MNLLTDVLVDFYNNNLWNYLTDKESLLYTVDVATHLKDFCDMASAINSREGQAAQEQQYGKQFHDCVRRRNKRMELTGFAKNLGGASFYVEYE